MEESGCEAALAVDEGDSALSAEASDLGVDLSDVLLAIGDQFSFRDWQGLRNDPSVSSCCYLGDSSSPFLFSIQPARVVKTFINCLGK